MRQAQPDPIPRPERDLGEGPLLAIYESEVLSIAHEAESWQKETGGDLFGIWSDRPIVYLATRAGPNAVRDNAHFRLDVEYLRDLSVELEVDWGLRYLGDWHSHHTLGLTSPSSGDRARIVRLGSKNYFERMAEVIVCLRPGNPAMLDFYPYAYEIPSEDPRGLRLAVLKGASPIREALIARKRRPEQRWGDWQKVGLDRVLVNGSIDERILVPQSNEGRLPVERAIAHARKALEEVAEEAVEVHETSFGFILAVPTRKDSLIGIAFDGSWPCRVLEVYEIDRSTRHSRRLDLEADAGAIVPMQIVQLYGAALATPVAVSSEESA